MMNYWLEAFRNEPNEEGKFQIIWKVAHFETHNSVSKEALLEMLRYMADYMLEEDPKDGGTDDENGQIEARQTVAWTPVAAVLPKPGERVLICLEHGFVGEGYLTHNGKWARYDELGSVEEIFHHGVSYWMPMPKAKQEETENE